MKIQNILTTIALVSVLFIGCSKEATVEPKQVNNDIEIYEISSPIGDEEDELIRIKSSVKKVNSGEAVEGAVIRIFNSLYAGESYTDINGNATLDVPVDGVYTYTITENGILVLTDLIELNAGTIYREDLIN